MLPVHSAVLLKACFLKTDEVGMEQACAFPPPRRVRCSLSGEPLVVRQEPHL